mgnify:CR=1 FL=1
MSAGAMATGRPLLLLPLLLLLAACVSTGGNNGRIGTPDPDEAARLYVELGFGYLKQDRLEIAEEKFARALELDPRRAAAMFGQGLVRHRQGRTVEGRKAVDRATRYIGDDEPLRRSVADWYCRVGAVDAAQEVLAPALRREEADAVLLLGRCLAANGQREAGETLLLEALREQPQSGRLLLGIAAMAAEQQDWLRAQAFLRRYEGVAPATSSSALLGLRIARALDDDAAEAAYLRLLERLKPGSSQKLRAPEAPRS